MIPFKYCIQIYTRYIKILIQPKKQNIKEWFAKSRQERYKYYNPDEEETTLYDNSDNIIRSTLFNIFAISTTSIDKKYCKDVNRQIHYNKSKLKIIYNTLNSIFNTPFKNFHLMKNTSKSNEELAIEINNNVRKISLYFLLLLPVIFMVILLCSDLSLVTYNLPTEASTKSNNPSPESTEWNVMFIYCLLVVIGLYSAAALLISFIWNTIMFIYLYYFTSKYTKVMANNTW